MTAGRFDEVDLDLLADYVGGALDGTGDEVVVARLIADDPAWSRAYESLAGAVESVRGGLASWGAEPIAMPTDVSDRLTAALAAAEPADPTEAEPADARKAEPASPRKATRVGASGVPGRSRAGRDRPPAAVPDRTRAGRERRGPAARRRWSRLAGPVAVAAAVAAVAGFGLSRLLGPESAGTTAGTAFSDQAGSPHRESQAGAGSAAPPRGLQEPSGERLVTSGTNYTPTTLTAAAVSAAAGHPSDGKVGREPNAMPDGDRGGSVPELRRLADRPALAACLDAIAAQHDRGPTTVDLVDYASFEGRPALVVLFVDQSGSRWAWVAGPNCGLPGSGADTRYQARVG